MDALVDEGGAACRAVDRLGDLVDSGPPERIAGGGGIEGRLGGGGSTEGRWGERP